MRLIVGIVCLVVFTGCGDSSSPDAGATSSVGVNQPASDGKFTFTVNDVNCGETQIGKGFMKAEAKGEYCIVSLTVENTGDEAQSLFSDAQFLYAGNRQFSADFDSSFALGKSGLLSEDINPGLSIEGSIAFDVPAGTTPTAVELHDSLLSGGVMVRL